MRRFLLVWLLTLGLAAPAQAEVSFDGTNDYVTAGSGSGLQMSTTLTVAAWINADLFHDTNNYIQSRRDTVDGSGYAMYVNNTNDRLRALVYNGTTVVGDDDTTTTLVAGTWYHAAFTYDGSIIRVYVNGVQEVTESGTITIPTETVPFLIGIYNSLAAEYAWDGLISDVRVYSRVLTAPEILELASSRLKYHDVTGTAPVAYWPLDDGADGATCNITFVDRSGNGNNGTGTNGPICRGESRLSYPWGAE